MSIEELIQENTAAMKDLATVMRELHVDICRLRIQDAKAGQPAVKPAKNNQEEKPAAETSAASQSAEGNSEGNADPVKELVYDDISKPFLQIIPKKGRPAALAVLQELGVPEGHKLSWLPADRYAEALEKINAALA